MDQPKEFNTLLLQEFIEAGQRIEAFTGESWDGVKYVPLTAGTTVWYKRIVQFPRLTTSRIRINIVKAKASPVLGDFSLDGKLEPAAAPEGGRAEK